MNCGVIRGHSLVGSIRPSLPAERQAILRDDKWMEEIASAVVPIVLKAAQCRETQPFPRFKAKGFVGASGG
ncbi:hypothetical protein OIU34_21565 [Pararhizobium sp. BT-229]|uniref:hypothetical protein n=1 Tax=Pararhizobium sp. BT-229 TaxID=2986923 RepID=UPI0021F72DB2|nr:hypothetical protein [Pararhizobium sp. BT-229]MCV9964482.1 hypothetical protein [Pararhizobium sp. BT-229]